MTNNRLKLSWVTTTQVHETCPWTRDMLLVFKYAYGLTNTAQKPALWPRDILDLRMSVCDLSCVLALCVCCALCLRVFVFVSGRLPRLYFDTSLSLQSYTQRIAR
jgi:hypothetical protein